MCLLSDFGLFLGSAIHLTICASPLTRSILERISSGQTYHFPTHTSVEHWFAFCLINVPCTVVLRIWIVCDAREPDNFIYFTMYINVVAAKPFSTRSDALCRVQFSGCTSGWVLVSWGQGLWCRQLTIQAELVICTRARVSRPFGRHNLIIRIYAWCSWWMWRLRQKCSD